jgi:HEPN domain-containing protein
MNRTAFKEIAKLRVKEAQSLLMNGHFPGAYYLIGYAVECALKACVAKQVKQYDFPDKKLANEAFTHDLERLIKVAGLAPDFANDQKANPALEVNWAIVKDWSESSRYDSGITEAQANDLYSACITRKNGILPWIKKRW